MHFHHNINMLNYQDIILSFFFSENYLYTTVNIRNINLNNIFPSNYLHNHVDNALIFYMFIVIIKI